MHLLPLLLAAVVIVVVNLSVVRTIVVAVAVGVTVMYPLRTHAMTMQVAPACSKWVTQQMSLPRPPTHSPTHVRVSL